jgi:hypothetical protein
MELRYRKNGLKWMPQRKDKTGTWVDFTEEWTKTHDEIYALAIAIAKLQNHNPFYSNTKTMFFDNEMQVMAFLGGCQGYFGKETKDFAVFLDESEK